MKLISYAALAASLPLFPAIAQQAPATDQPALNAAGDSAGGTADPSAPPTPGDAAKAHPDEDQAIVITGTKRAAGDVLGNVSVVDTEELTHDMKPSLGDTLADMPGVSSTSFGPSASRPILRGEQGERAPVLIDGISSLDLSATDPDHAVAINPLTAERIEVLHGPGALLYSPSAIGGVVNVIDTRIPRHVPADSIDVDAMLNYGSAANERSANIGVDVSLGGHLVAHADGAYSKYDDLHVGGFLLSKQLRQQALANPDPDIRALADLRDKLPNTAGRSDDIAGGLAYVDGDLNVGVSVSRHDTRYGVPIRFSLDPDIEAEVPTIDAHQTRGDARVNIPIGGFFNIVEFRGGISKYHHSELEEDGEVGSRFLSNGGEARADVVQNERGGWGGTTGVDYLSQDARIRGNEKYLPDSRKQNLGLFTLQAVQSGKIRFEGAGRVDFARLHAKEDPIIADIVDEFGEESGEDFEIGSEPVRRSFTAFSGSIGANYDLQGWRAGLSFSHSERAPGIDELFSFGPHGGSAQFLIGDPDLKLEKSNGVELSVHRTTGPIHVQGSIYYSRYSNFIFEAPTGEIEDNNLAVYEYRQAKAKYYGFEVESDIKFGKAMGINWGGELVADAVRAKIDGFGNAPQIPPFRILAGLTGTRGQVDGRVEVERTSAQHRNAPNETETPGFTLVNASLDWHPFAANPELTLSLTANNIFDVTARRATSELKDYAPLAGRDLRLSARIGF